MMMSSSTDRKKVIFLGTPDVAAQTLNRLLKASEEGRGGGFDISAVVTQPPAPAGRKKKLTPSPVQVLAEEKGLIVLTPEKAKDDNFIETLTQIGPDLCITAAYGQFLPTKFLNIPKFGTLNIHPSLLPRWRGASPVQRALEAGDAVTGVSVLFTVLKMDAGPIAKSIEYTCTGDEQAPWLLEHLFGLGTDGLVEVLPAVWDGTIKTTEQDEATAVAADKISKADGLLDFGAMGAAECHNRGRGFAGWPGVQSTFLIGESDEPTSIKILTTKLVAKESGSSEPTQEVKLKGNLLEVICGDGSVLGVTELQPPNKKGMAVKAWWNGLRGERVRWCRPSAPPLSS
ncbi:unnamed protein product [Heterosigma akashiwo]